MSATDYILFSSICDTCRSAQEHRARCSTCADFGGYDGNDRLCNREYRIGDVMDWYPNPEARDTWPGDYSFVSELKGAGSVYVTEGCYGECVSCLSQSRFYFLFNNRQIMRLIGKESWNLNLTSVVRS